MSNMWAAPNVPCICVAHIEGATKPHPEFMQQYTIADIMPNPTPFAPIEHAVGLVFNEFAYVYCICAFRPLEKIEDDVEDDISAPIDTRAHELIS